MKTRFIEAENRGANGNAFNWGKFMVAQFGQVEWESRSSLPEASPGSLLLQRGWTPSHVLVVDLETGEGAFFLPGGLPSADLQKHAIWVCPLFEPFLGWLYKNWTGDVFALDRHVVFDFEEAPPAMAGYRRGGQ